MRAILIVRLGALGDVVHALPVAAALRDRFPAARIDWVVDERHEEVLRLAPVVDRRIVFRSRSLPVWRRVVDLRRALAGGAWDAAVDVQGLLKSAVVARWSGAPRVLGFAAPHLREPAARFLYTETCDPGNVVHVTEKNLALAGRLGASTADRRFPIEAPASAALDAVRRLPGVGGGPFAVLNPGAAWPNKRWAPAKLARVAGWLRAARRLPSVVTWGPGDEARAAAVVEGADGAARLAPPTRVPDLVAVLRAASVVVSGDTGPLHLAAAVGTPVVGLYGPTDPRRNGPWSSRDVAVSRFDDCRCRWRRRCRAARWCLDDVTVDEVAAAIDRRLAAVDDTPGPDEDEAGPESVAYGSARRPTDPTGRLHRSTAQTPRRHRGDRRGRRPDDAPSDAGPSEAPAAAPGIVEAAARMMRRGRPAVPAGTGHDGR